MVDDDDAIGRLTKRIGYSYGHHPQSRDKRINWKRVLQKTIGISIAGLDWFCCTGVASISRRF